MLFARILCQLDVALAVVGGSNTSNTLQTQHLPFDFQSVTKKLLVTSASLLVTGALLVATRSY